MTTLALEPVLSYILYAALGLGMLVGGFALVDLLVPAKLWNEIIDKKNSALAILAAGFAIALGIIIVFRPYLGDRPGT